MLSRLDDPAVLPDEPLITAITLAELTVGPLVVISDHERAARQAHLQQAESDFEALPLDASAARARFPYTRAIPMTSAEPTGSRWSPSRCRPASTATA